MPSARSTSNPRPLIVILGPTASGKSPLGVRLAKRFGGVIISADSRQVYRGLDLGTGKITRAEMRGVPHRLLNVSSPRSQYSVARYVRDALQVIKRLPPTTPIFLVGGSPFYIDALIKPGTFSAVPPNPQLRRRLANKTTPQLLAVLRRQSPDRYRTIDRANRRRLIRAIEISLASIPPGGISNLAHWQILKIGIRWPNKRLFPLIDHRVDRRLGAGMVDEVRRLHRQGLSWQRLDAFGLEYRFLSRYARGLLTRREAVTQLKSAIHDFARRQMTWWKRDPDIHWVAKPAAAQRLVKDFLRTN